MRSMLSCLNALSISYGSRGSEGSKGQTGELDTSLSPRVTVKHPRVAIAISSKVELSISLRDEGHVAEIGVPMSR